MNTNIFVVYILSLAFGLSYFYSEAREYFSPVDGYKAKVVHLEERVQEERFRHLLTSYEFQDFKAHVATLIPSVIQEKGLGEKSYPLRTLASIVQKGSGDNLAMTRAKGIFESGKKYFRQKDYAAAINLFRQLFDKHPYSVYLPEALFLTVESYFVLRHYDDCVHFVNKMIDLYPDSELTGYALLRLGKIYEFQDRHDEAVDLYKTILKTFPDRGLASLANTSLRAVEL